MKHSSLPVILLCVFLFFSCNSEKTSKAEMYYVEETGEFANDIGLFRIKFPLSPKMEIIKNKVGDLKYNVFQYKAMTGRQKIYLAQFSDLPEVAVKSVGKENFYNTAINSFQHSFDRSFQLEKKEEIKIGAYSGYEFVLREKGYTNNVHNKEQILKGRIFFRANRIFSIIYLGEEQKEMDTFLESFRFMK